MTGLDDISQLYLVTEPVDFRKGIDGLGTYVQSILNTDPFQNAMFVFTNKRHNKLKLLHYDGTGFWLL
ncbi:IS66 family insertion sequence element accessory protein TnpB, partial [Faecalibaculum rodentium]